MRCFTLETANKYLLELQRISNEYYAPRPFNERLERFPKQVADLKRFAEEIRVALDFRVPKMESTRRLSSQMLDNYYAECLGYLNDILSSGNTNSRNVTNLATPEMQQQRFKNLYSRLAVLENNASAIKKISREL